MEQKKLVSIVLSVIATLIIIFAIAVGIFFPPGDNTQGQMVYSQTGSIDFVDPNKVDTNVDTINDVIRANENTTIPLTEANQSDPDGDQMVVYGEVDVTPVADFDSLFGDEEATPKPTLSVVTGDPDDKVVVAPRATATPKPRRTQTVTRRATATPVPSGPKYWIQVGSYSTETRANTSIEALEEEGFTARVFTKDVDGKMYFRVRVGPYDTKAEADKFNSWVKKIDGFSESYVTKVY